MSRISLREAYDNKDVIAWLVRHQDAIEELQNILRDITPGGDLTNVVTKTGNQVIDGEKTFIGKIIADCDIIQNGSAYETHAEQVFSHNDLMIMRDGAVNGLSTGEYSGIQVEKYDGANTGRMVMDNTGIMRVGKLNDEQPLATRDEAVNMTSGSLVKWDGVNKKMIAPASNVGSDTQPVKIVNGEPVQVSSPLATEAYANLFSHLYDPTGNDWLSVDLNDQFGVNNRIICVGPNAANLPQQTGESVYCYYGTKIPIWLQAGFVIVLAIGMGTDSGAHMWMNGYNQNAGTWEGWKRIY